MKENLLYIASIGFGAYCLNELGKIVEMRDQYQTTSGKASSVTDAQIMAPKVASYLMIGFGVVGLWHSSKS